jgi:hypothetical protein
MWYCADYQSLKGHEFEVRHSAGMERVRLHEVKSLEKTDTTESFSLLFVSLCPDLVQGTYSIYNSNLGALDLFLVPVGPCSDDPALWAYESVFNIRVNESG